MLFFFFSTFNFFVCGSLHAKQKQKCPSAVEFCSFLMCQVACGLQGLGRCLFKKKIRGSRLSCGSRAWKEVPEESVLWKEGCV